jgi:hypothetical protein
MDYRFKADEWQTLSPEERARRCRLLAAEAQTLADNAPPGLGHRYQTIADQWLELAREIEQHNNRDKP